MAFSSYPAKGGIPSGDTASRPSSPAIGDTYYDGTLGFLLIWDGTAFIPCSAPAAQPSIVVTDVGTNVAYGTVQGSIAFTEGIAGGKAAGFTAVHEGTSITSSSSPIVFTITGTPNSYSFSGTAYNGFGTSPSSLNVSQNLTSVPQAPTIGTATASTTTEGQVTVTWTNGATGGKALSAITITPYLNGTTAQTSRTAATTSSTSYTFTTGQLTAGSSYTFKVKTTNANGDSLESAASNSVVAPQFISVDYLVVAGGGGGGGNVDPFYARGGGGAGGLRSTVTATGGGGTLESAIPLVVGTNYTVTVGAGGAGGEGINGGANGSNSVFATITSTGGGAGGKPAAAVNTGAAGGSSGGGTGGAQGAASGAATANQGYRGGSGNSAGNTGGGGGGGAGGGGQQGGTLSADGVNAAGPGVAAGGAGGSGVAVSITGSSVTYAGGGGGGGGYANTNQGNDAGPGGSGGGGAGDYRTNINAQNGTVNTGGGGGGAIGGNTTTALSGNGGRGVVILRWLTSAGSISVGAGLTADSTGTSGSYSYKRFTDGTGNVSFS